MKKAFVTLLVCLSLTGCSFHSASYQKGYNDVKSAYEQVGLSRFAGLVGSQSHSDFCKGNVSFIAGYGATRKEQNDYFQGCMDFLQSNFKDSHSSSNVPETNQDSGEPAPVVSPPDATGDVGSKKNSKIDTGSSSNQESSGGTSTDAGATGGIG